ncbi:disrupted in renal carcinoma protein 2-like, partial [Aphis craccivora]
MMCVFFFFFVFVSVYSITSQNNAPISNYGGGFRCKSEYPWCIIEITKAPFYVSNDTLHRDLLIPTVKNVAKTLYKRFHLKLANHRNPFIQDLSSRTLPGDPGRRLKRTWCRDLLAN